MRLVLDTNVVVSGLLWSGLPKIILQNINQKQWEIFTSPTLLQEFLQTLSTQKLQKFLTNKNKTVQQLYQKYTSIVQLVTPKEVPQIFIPDPDDNYVLACAQACEANYLITGDKALQKFKNIKHCKILSPREFKHLFL